jgi:membrane protein
MTGRDILKLIRSCFAQWSDRNAPRLGAALAYYTLLSIAPLLILLVAIFGLVFDRNTAEYRLLGQVSEVAGSSAAKALQSVLESAHQSSHGWIASVIALITLLFGASGVFVELRDSLNTIWDAPPLKSSSWRTLVTQRLISFGMVLALGFLLLVSLILSTALAVVMKFFEGLVPMRAALLGEVANFVIPLFAIAVLFALIFKFVPDVRIDWADVAIGAFVTALFFEIGKALLSLYIATAGVGSTYGAAGSLVAFVVWVYYSAQIFFFGAIFARQYADAFGSHHRIRFRHPERSTSA